MNDGAEAVGGPVVNLWRLSSAGGGGAEVFDAQTRVAAEHLEVAALQAGGVAVWPGLLYPQLHH